MDLERLLQLVQQPRVIAGIVAAVVVLYLLKRLLSRPATSAHVTPARCQACGWTGQVSKFKPVCPRCAKPISL